MKVRYEIKKLYANSTIYGTWHEDKELCVPAREIEDNRAEAFINNVLIPMGATHYETTKAHFYITQQDARHITQYIYYK